MTKEETDKGSKNYTNSFTIERSAEEVFSSPIATQTTTAATQKITELAPGKKFVWHIAASKINFVYGSAFHLLPLACSGIRG